MDIVRVKRQWGDRLCLIGNIDLGYTLTRGTPQEVFEAKVKAGPRSMVPAVHFRVRYDRVDQWGKVSLRYDSKLLHIGVGYRYRGWRVVLFVADRDVRVVAEDGELLRTVRLDPSRDYQRRSA